MLCYIRCMLLDHQLVPQALATPRSFVGLMALYESNYLRLLRLIPDLEQLDGCFHSRVAGDCELLVEVLERCRYTVTLSITYLFQNSHGISRDPDLVVRAYLDGRLAEAMRMRGGQRHDALRRLLKLHGSELNIRWRRNIVLNKWLEYLTDSGHLILDR